MISLLMVGVVFANATDDALSIRGVTKHEYVIEVQVKEAAPKRLVSELVEVQKAYDLMERKEEFDDVGSREG
ncbi:hypothetical protein Tco_1365641 [Tanacetum coccineum]